MQTELSNCEAYFLILSEEIPRCSNTVTNTVCTATSGTRHGATYDNSNQHSVSGAAPLMYAVVIDGKKVVSFIWLNLNQCYSRTTVHGEKSYRLKEASNILLRKMFYKRVYSKANICYLFFCINNF